MNDLWLDMLISAKTVAVCWKVLIYILRPQKQQDSINF